MSGEAAKELEDVSHAAEPAIAATPKRNARAKAAPRTTAKA
nr:hypothetical protein GCM10020093_086210 [Planobispora longispora]